MYVSIARFVCCAEINYYYYYYYYYTTTIKIRWQITLAPIKLHKNNIMLYTFTRVNKHKRNVTYPVSLNCDSALLIKTFSWRVSSCRSCCWKVVPSASITTLSGMSHASSSARICCCCSSWRWRRGVVVCDTCTTSES